MNLDDRARQARNSLNDHVNSDLDLREARRSLEARGLRQRSDRRRARVAAVGITVVALLGGVAIFSGSDDPRTPDDVSSEDFDRDRDADSDSEIIEAMPLGPTDGKESWRLPVAVSPQDGLEEGDTIRIYGRGFDPHDSLGVVHCVSEADTQNAGVDGCDLTGGSTAGGFAGVQYVSADENGDVVADIVVTRYIETPGYGRVDCASGPERCLIGMGAISNYDRSGGAYINFAGAPPFAEPTFTASPDPTQLTPGQEVQVDVTNWVPGRQLRIRQCVVGEGGFDGSERCQPLLDTRADGAGAFSGTVAVNAEVVDEDGTVACDGDCVLDATGIGIPEGTTAPFPPAIPIDFAEAAADLTTTTHPGTTTTPPPVQGNPATTTVVDGSAGSGDQPTTDNTTDDTTGTESDAPTATTAASGG